MRTKSVRILGMMGVVFTGLLASVVQAEELAVPGEYATIQSALNAAVDGDEVVVSPGTYFESIDLLGKEVTLRSVDPLDPKIVASTILDGTHEPDSIVNCDSGETLSTVIDGLTFTNGIATLGGAIDVRDGGLTIRRCVFEGNRSSGSFESTGGGALYATESAIVLHSSQFIGNRSVGEGSGGALKLTSCTTHITTCSFIENSSVDHGGAIDKWGGSCELESCTLVGNSALFGGAAVFSVGTTNIINCSIDENEAAWGAGLMLSSSTNRIANTTFRGNLAAGNGIGGAVCCHSGTHSFDNCTMSGNVSDLRGGACYVTNNAHLYLRCCTVVGNSSPNAGAVFVNESHGGGDYHFSNSIVYANGSDPLTLGEATFAWSNIEGGAKGIGNIDAAPLFVDADGPDDIFGTEDDDLRLQAGSPCIDAGDNLLLPLDVLDLNGDGDTGEVLPVDAALSSRVTDGDGDEIATVDMGAFESPALIPACAADLDGSGVVDVADLLSMLALWGACDGCSADVNGDAVVDTTDLLFLLATWGECG